MNLQSSIFLRKQRHKSTAMLANDVQASPGEYLQRSPTCWEGCFQDDGTYVYHKGYTSPSLMRVFDDCLPFIP